tara:strand:+ start:5020 stop:5325 length:306 start_codon:yes stop_codon:yes gene_type:complete
MTDIQSYIIIFFIVFTILIISFLVYSTKDYKEFIADFDFTADHDDELSFKRGNKIIMIRKIDDDWGSGYNTKDPDITGIFPLSFVNNNDSSFDLSKSNTSH